MSGRTDRLRHAFEAFGTGDLSGFRELLAEDAQWLGVPGSGPAGETPI